VEIKCRVYRPRRLRESPLFRLVEQHLEEPLRVWPTRFQRQHGPLRPVVERVLAHRHVVLTIPRLLRPLSRRRRDLLTELARAGAEAFPHTWGERIDPEDKQRLYDTAAYLVRCWPRSRTATSS
jgi:hypothetical protein